MINFFFYSILCLLSISFSALGQVYIPDLAFRKEIKNICPTCLTGKGNKYLDTTNSGLQAGNSNSILELHSKYS